MAEPTDPRCVRFACALGALALAGLATSVRREVVRKLSEVE